MIIRLLVIDPKPRDPRRDVVVYQVPEKSRELELLLEVFEAAGVKTLVFDERPAAPKRKRSRKHGNETENRK